MIINKISIRWKRNVRWQLFSQMTKFSNEKVPFSELRAIDLIRVVHLDDFEQQLPVDHPVDVRPVAGNEGVDVVGRVMVQSVSDEVIDAKPDLVSDVSECLFQLHELLELLVPYDLSQSLPGGGFQGGHQKNSWGHFEKHSRIVSA